MTREEGHGLIERYIRITPYIQMKIDTFVEQNFEDYFIIGVHYRGTDKDTEAPRVSYEDVFLEISKALNKIEEHEYKIFVATDEQAFRYLFPEQFPLQVIYTDSIRSVNGEPVHMSQGNNYQKGEDAVIDCLLLSKCNFLIRTSSNLSYCSCFFNPTLPFILLNPGVHDKKPEPEQVVF